MNCIYCLTKTAKYAIINISGRDRPLNLIIDIAMKGLIKDDDGDLYKQIEARKKN